MLELLRKYQRYLYLVITVVIIVSFSFFGTYSTLGSGTHREQVAFTAVDGTKVSRGELEQLALFIGTDGQDKLVLGGLWGPNFLNDGVVRKDFLQTGLAQELFAQYGSEIGPDLDKRLEKEKHFTLYTHPQVPIVGVETAWSFFAPDMKAKYEALKAQKQGASPKAFEARVQLYLADQQLPGLALQQILQHQQRQYNLPRDPNLASLDLSLFGYHTLDDWFGPRFLKLVAEFIINSAKIAEQRGYRVSKQEALADLRVNAEKSYQDNRGNPHLGVANGNEYFNEQLNRMGLDQNSAAKVWREVLLFRRLFHDVAQGVFVDPNSLQGFNNYAKATIAGDLYQLPKEFRFKEMNTLKRFENYLQAVSERPNGLLEMPNRFLTVSEVKQKFPELVQKRYLIDISQVPKIRLQSRVSVKETWNWEENNLSKLKEKFPELVTLDALDEEKRAQVDAFAREEIVNSHPEWLEQALQEAEPKRVAIALAYKGTTPIAGLNDPESLMRLLDKAPKGEQDPALAAFTGDQKSFYKIVLLDRTQEPEIRTFAEALRSGALEAQGDMAPVLKAIYDAYAAGIAPEKAPSQLLDEVSASLRFFPYMSQARDQLKKNPENSAKWLQTIPEEESTQLASRAPLADQWKLLKTLHTQERAQEGVLETFFAMEPGSWSPVQTPANGDLSFFQLTNKGTDATQASLEEKVKAAQALLADESEGQLMEQLLHEMKSKKALSLDFMNVKEE